MRKVSIVNVEIGRKFAEEEGEFLTIQVVGKETIKKIENSTIFIPKVNSYCRLKRSPKGPRFKVLSE